MFSGFGLMRMVRIYQYRPAGNDPSSNFAQLKKWFHIEKVSMFGSHIYEACDSSSFVGIFDSPARRKTCCFFNVRSSLVMMAVFPLFQVLCSDFFLYPCSLHRRLSHHSYRRTHSLSSSRKETYKIGLIQY